MAIKRHSVSAKAPPRRVASDRREPGLILAQPWGFLVGAGKNYFINRYATNSPVSREQKKYPAPPNVLPSLNPSTSSLNTRVSGGNS